MSIAWIILIAFIYYCAWQEQRDMDKYTGD